MKIEELEEAVCSNCKHTGCIQHCGAFIALLELMKLMSPVTDAMNKLLKLHHLGEVSGGSKKKEEIEPRMVMVGDSNRRWRLER